MIEPHYSVGAFLNGALPPDHCYILRPRLACFFFLSLSLTTHDITSTFSTLPTPERGSDIPPDPKFRFPSCRSTLVATENRKLPPPWLNVSSRGRCPRTSLSPLCSTTSRGPPNAFLLPISMSHRLHAPLALVAGCRGSEFARAPTCAPAWTWISPGSRACRMFLCLPLKSPSQALNWRRPFLMTL